MDRMRWLRYLALVVLCVWIGGLAGNLFGAIFRRFELLSCCAAVILLATLVIRAALGPRPRRLGVRVWIGLILLGLNVADLVIKTPRFDASRHELSTALMSITIVAGLGLLWFEAHD